MNRLGTKDVLKTLIRESIKNITANDTHAMTAAKKCLCGCSPSVIREAYRGMPLGAIIESYYSNKCDSRLKLAASVADGTAKRHSLAEKREIQHINHLMRRVASAGNSSLRGLLGDPDALRYRLAELSANPYISLSSAQKIKAEIGSLVLEVNDSRLRRHLRDVFHSLDECSCMQGQRETPAASMNSAITFYRPGTPEFFSNARNLRTMYQQNQYSPTDDWEAELLSTDIGDWGMFSGKTVPLDFPVIEVDGEWDEPCETCSGRMSEAKYKGKEVELGKPKRGGGRAYVYVRDPKTGNVKKVSFGSSMPDAMGDSDAARARRKSFGNRHNCAKKKDRTQAGYWSCRATKFFGRNIPGWW